MHAVKGLQYLEVNGSMVLNSIRVDVQESKITTEVRYLDPDDCDLMECVEPRDKDGDDIYEGDIVVTGLSDEHVRSVVRIGEAETYGEVLDHPVTRPYYGVYLEGSIDLEEYLLSGKMYVIGNIYENSDLLQPNSQ